MTTMNLKSPCPNCERLEGKYQEKNDDFRATFLKCLKQQEEIQRLQKQLEMCRKTLNKITKDRCIHVSGEVTPIKTWTADLAIECLAKLEGGE